MCELHDYAVTEIIQNDGNSLGKGGSPTPQSHGPKKGCGLGTVRTWTTVEDSGLWSAVYGGGTPTTMPLKKNCGGQRIKAGTRRITPTTQIQSSGILLDGSAS